MMISDSGSFFGPPCRTTVGLHLMLSSEK